MLYRCITSVMAIHEAIAFVKCTTQGWGEVQRYTRRNSGVQTEICPWGVQVVYCVAACSEGLLWCTDGDFSDTVESSWSVCLCHVHRTDSKLIFN